MGSLEAKVPQSRLSRHWGPPTIAVAGRQRLPGASSISSISSARRGSTPCPSPPRPPRAGRRTVGPPPGPMWPWSADPRGGVPHDGRAWQWVGSTPHTSQQVGLYVHWRLASIAASYRPANCKAPRLHSMAGAARIITRVGFLAAARFRAWRGKCPCIAPAPEDLDAP